VAVLPACGANPSGWASEPVTRETPEPTPRAANPAAPESLNVAIGGAQAREAATTTVASAEASPVSAVEPRCGETNRETVKQMLLKANVPTFAVRDLGTACAIEVLALDLAADLTARLHALPFEVRIVAKGVQPA
jgi:hypothetical protein